MQLQSGRNNRVAAVDVMRAITMTLMLFVNDIPGLKEIPRWLLHARADEDMMGFADTIFPAFIFCMGMSVVLAMNNRYTKGDTTLQVITHMAGRTFALIVMGLFTLNCSGVGIISYDWFAILMVVGFFLVWGVYPRTSGLRRYIFKAMRVAGAALLIFLVIYKDVNGSPFTTGWWGILGLIGWTYAVCSCIYLFTRGSFGANVMVWIVLVLLSLGSHSQLIPYNYASHWVLLTFVPGDWTLHAIGFSGMLTILIMQRYSHVPGRILATMMALGVVMAGCFFASHPFWIVSKIQATPSWMFYCLAIFFPVFGALYLLCDIYRKTSWFKVIRAAGTATLTCYLIPYLWYAVQSILGLDYPPVLCAGVGGLIRSAIFSFAVIGITWLLIRIRVTIKV